MQNESQLSYQVKETRETPNPLAFQYILDRPVISSGAKSFVLPEEVAENPFAKAVFSLENVESVYLRENFVTVTFLPGPDLELLVEAVEQLIEDDLAFYENSEEEPSSILKCLDEIDFASLSDEAKAEVIDAVLDESVRPALAKDGGGLTVLEVNGNVVRVRYQGACGSCPASQGSTLRAIENVLLGSLKEELKVIAN